MDQEVKTEQTINKNNRGEWEADMTRMSVHFNLSFSASFNEHLDIDSELT